VPDDRFDDLGPAERTAADRFADLDEGDMEAERREREERGPGPPRPAGRYTWVVGVAALTVVIVVAFNSLPNAGRGYRGPKEGDRIPVFAGPLATGEADGDTNIKQSKKDGSASNDTPACQVRGADVFNVCDLFAKRPLVLILSAPSDECDRQLEAAARLSRELPEVQFAATIAARSRDQARDVIERAGVEFPVAYDRPPPILFNLYRVAFCSTAFVERGGVLREFHANEPLEEAELREGVRKLVAP
jgi:hypothetical protein